MSAVQYSRIQFSTVLFTCEDTVALVFHTDSIHLNIQYALQIWMTPSSLVCIICIFVFLHFVVGVAHLLIYLPSLAGQVGPAVAPGVASLLQGK